MRMLLCDRIPLPIEHVWDFRWADKEYNQPFLNFPAPFIDSLRCQPKQLAFFSPKLHHGGSASPITGSATARVLLLTAVRYSFLPDWAQNCFAALLKAVWASRHHVLFCHFLPAILRHQEPRTDSLQSPAMVRSYSFWQSRSLHIQRIPYQEATAER